MRRQRILVVTDDGIGSSMAGPAIRAWNIADVLADHHEVRLASTRRATASSPRFAVCDGSGVNLAGLAERQDIVILQGFTLRSHPWLLRVGARIVIDLYDPIHLEMLEESASLPSAQRTAMLRDGLDALRIQIENGDFFLCATERQRDLWLGHLSALGRVNAATYTQDRTLRRLIEVAPFGLPEDPPSAGGGMRGVMPGIGPDDQILLWAGGVYNWFDPVTLVAAVGRLAPSMPRLRLVFLGTRHPTLDDLSTTMLRRAIELATSLGLIDRHVFFREGWVPYADRGAYLADADIGVSTHVLHVETAYSFRTRMLDYLWAGLPVVCTEGDEFAVLVARYGLGRVVPEQDAGALATAIGDLLRNPAQLQCTRDAARALAPRFYWRHALEPLTTYCDDPWTAADAANRLRPVAPATRARPRLAVLIDEARDYRDVNGTRRLITRGARRVALSAVGALHRR